MAHHRLAADRLETTARWTAAVRAKETDRPDGLFEDPWAGALAGPDGAAWIARRPPESVIPITIRTRYFDDWLGRVVDAPAVRQVVLMAAGLDARAFRLAWPEGTIVYELDRPAVLRHKAAVLDAAGAVPRCLRRAVEADLAAPWADGLTAAGFDPRRPAAWLLEGFLFYLPAEAVTRILDEVTRLAAPGSRLGFDIVNAATLVSPWTKPWVDMQAHAGAPWLGTMDDPVASLADRGWSASLTQAGAPDAHFGWWVLPVVPTTLPDFPHSWYVTAERPA